MYVDAYPKVAEELVGERIFLSAPLVVIEGRQLGKRRPKHVAGVDGRGDELFGRLRDRERCRHAAQYPRNDRLNRFRHAPTAGPSGSQKTTS